MTCKAKQENNGVCPHHNLQCGWPKCNELEQEPVAWVPYLSDRADGVKGHYAIARWNPRGYREVWNLRRHEWGAYSDDVLSLEEADTLLRLITIPTRKVTSPQPPQRKPLTDEQIDRDALKQEGTKLGWHRRFARAIEAAHGIKE